MEAIEAIQLALVCVGVYGNDPLKVAETHPPLAGALRVLLPFAAPRTRYAMGLDLPQPEWLRPCANSAFDPIELGA